MRLGAVVGAGCLVFLLGCGGDGPGPLVDSGELVDLRVLAGLDEPLDASKDALWCGAFNLAWREACEGVVKEKIRLEGDPPVVEVLNRQAFDKSMVSPESSLVMAGLAGEGILEKVNTGLREKFGDAAPAVEVSFASPKDILAYAYLSKDFLFVEPYDRLKEPVRFRSGNGGGVTEVEAFGIEEHGSGAAHRQAMSRQVTVMFYREAGLTAGVKEFALRFEGKSKTDELVVAQVKPGASLLETVKAVQDAPMVEGEESKMQEDEPLAVPVLDSKVSHSFRELLRKRVLNSGFEDLFVAEARQDVRFSLNEEGARLRSSADFVATAGIGERSFRVERPFLLWMKEKDAALPYFVMWVATPEFMEKG